MLRLLPLALILAACGGTVGSPVVEQADASVDSALDAAPDADLPDGDFRICRGSCLTTGAACGGDLADPGVIVQCGADSPGAWVALLGTSCVVQPGGAYCCKSVACPGEAVDGGGQ